MGLASILHVWVTVGIVLVVVAVIVFIIAIVLWSDFYYPKKTLLIPAIVMTAIITGQIILCTVRDTLENPINTIYVCGHCVEGVCK